MMGKRRTRYTAGGSQRGFTLIELMTVIVIVGVLAALAIYGTRKYVFASRTAEAGEMINAIKTAQEVYRSDSMAYLDVSGAHALTDMSTFYPNTKPGNFKTGWGDQSTDVGKRWKSLNVRPDGSGMYFAYGCSAGDAPTDQVDSYDVNGYWQISPKTTAITNWPPAPPPFNGAWYVVKVVGNLNGGDSSKSQLWVTASFTDQVFNNTEVE